MKGTELRIINPEFIAIIIMLLMMHLIFPFSEACGRTDVDDNQSGNLVSGRSDFDKNKKIKPVFAVPRNDIAGLSNFAKISDNLYRGAQPSAEGFKSLKKMGVKTIISLRAFHSDRSMIKGNGLYYMRVKFNTWHAENEDILKVFKLILNPEYQPVFIHCQHGSDRTGTVSALYRNVFQNWEMSDAMAEMKNFGFHEIWSNLIKYLNGFDSKNFIELLKKEPMPIVEFIK